MSKVGVAANMLSLLAAGVGLTAAVVQHREAADARDISTEAQKRLQQSISTGDINIAVIQSVIGDLGQITGAPPPKTFQQAATPSFTAAAQSQPSNSLPAAVVPLASEVTAIDRAQSPQKLRIDEDVPIDLFGEGVMYTMDQVAENMVVLVDAQGMRDRLEVGRRMKVRGTKCEIDLLRTHEGENNNSKGWAEFRSWC